MLKTLLPLGIFCALPFLLSAQVVLPVTWLPVDSITPKVLMLFDHGRRLNKTQAWSAWQDGQFQPYAAKDLPGKFQIGQYQFWLVFVLENLSADTLDLIVSKIHHSDTIWRQETGFSSVALCIPRWFPASLHPELLPYEVKALGALRLLPHQRDTFLAQTYRHKPDNIIPKISRPEVYELQRFHDTKYENLFFCIFFGAIAAIFLFAAAQYVQHRDKAFLWYALYLAVMLFTTWRNIEESSPWLYSTYYLAPSTWTRIGQMAAYFCCYSLFVYHLLGKKPASLRSVVRLMVGISLLAFAIDLLFMLQGWYHESWLLFYLYRAVVIALSFLFLGLLWRNSKIVARLIFVGTLCVLVGESASMIWDGKVNSFGSGIGVSLEICFLSIAIAYRSRLFRAQHNHLQISHIAQLEENNRLREIARREEVEAFKNRFYANITHEFRTPLTVLLGLAAWLREHPDPEARQSGQMMERNGQDLLRLVNQLLDLGKLEAGALQLQMLHGDVINFLKVTTESFTSLAAMKQQQLILHTSPSVLLMDFDPNRLQQILTNLVGNALKFASPGGQITVRCLSSTALRKFGTFGKVPTLCIEVRDNGPGIPPEALPHIFDRFYQTPHGANSPATGTGIGLALVKELVTLLQGTVTVKSRVGVGSIFRVYLPITNEASKTLPDLPLPGPPTLPLPERSMTRNHPDRTDLPLLLLVEDNADLVQYLCRLLSRQYRLLTASDGRAGLEQAFRYMPDLVLSDVMMPGMDGFTFCQTLKEDPRTSHIPIVMLTARATITDKITGLRRGADAWLTKPFDRAELFATLEAQLESRRRLRDYFASKTAAAPPADLEELVEKENEFLTRVRACVDEHLNEPYEVGQLARDLHLSESQLYRKLKALGTASPALFVRSHRLGRAATLLTSTDLPIAEIGYRTGFNDPAYFANCFHKEFGKSPSEWRKG